jgi:dTDP-4-amino-4,6-dideoxygalactose transaminase
MISFFIPDMPTTDQLIPYLREMDNNLWYSNFGPLYEKFSLDLTKKCFEDLDPERTVLVSSGTSAIELALKSLELPIGSKVLTSCFTFPATIEAIINVGLSPIICDVDKSSWLLTPEIAEQHISQLNIAAVVPVAIFGIPVCSESWSKFTTTTGIPVVIDAAAALINQTIKENIIYAFSLHATKPLGIGEGGFVVSPSKNQTLLIKKLSNFGFEQDRSISQIGTNAKLSEYHCAVGIAQLDRLDKTTQKRRQIFDHYLNALNETKLPLTLQAGIDQHIPSNLYVVIESNTAEEVTKALLDKNIETRRLYYPLIHKHPAFANIIVAGNGLLSNAEKLSERGLALPFHMHLSNKEINIIVNSLTKILIT